MLSQPTYALREFCQHVDAYNIFEPFGVAQNVRGREQLSMMPTPIGAVY